MSFNQRIAKQKEWNVVGIDATLLLQTVLHVLDQRSA